MTNPNRPIPGPVVDWAALQALPEVPEPPEPEPPADWQNDFDPEYQPNMTDNDPTPPATLPDLEECLKGNEIGDADLFKAMFTGKFIFDHWAGVWYEFTGHFWGKSDVWLAVGNEVATQYADHALLLFKQAANEAETEKAKEFFRRATALRSKKRVIQVIDWAGRKMPLPQGWDTTPMLLPCVNGVIDLRTGILRKGQPRDYLRAHCPTPFHGLDCPAPHWEKFISEIFSNDADLVRFINRLFGYIVSGKSNEKLLPMFYGENGNNGKTTLIEAISQVLGADFCVTNSADVLMEKKFSDGDKPSPFIVSLPGKRLFWAKESREGQRFNLGLIKELTGNDTMSGRAMYARQAIEFRPTHVPILVTNRRPHLTADDDAAWNRILPVEFENSFVPNPNPKNPHEFLADKKLPERLAAESPGIFAWLVRGCLAWQRDGLNPPQKVNDWKKDYRDSEDDFGTYRADRLEEKTAAKTAAIDIYTDYVDWAKKRGMNPMAYNAFGKRMSKHYEKGERTASGMTYQVILTL